MKGRDFVNKKAQEAATKYLTQIDPQSQDPASNWFFGTISPDRSTITDSLGNVYQLSYTGEPKQVERAYKTGANTAFVQAEPYRSSFGCSGSGEKPFIIFQSDEYNSSAGIIAIHYYLYDPIRKLQAELPIQETFQPLTQFSGSIASLFVSDIRFSPDGKHIAAVGSQQANSSQPTLNPINVMWCIFHNPTIVQDSEGNTSITTSEIESGNYLFNNPLPLTVNPPTPPPGNITTVITNGSGGIRTTSCDFTVFSSSLVSQFHANSLLLAAPYTNTDLSAVLLDILIETNDSTSGGISSLCLHAFVDDDHYTGGSHFTVDYTVTINSGPDIDGNYNWDLTVVTCNVPGTCSTVVTHHTSPLGLPGWGPPCGFIGSTGTAQDYGFTLISNINDSTVSINTVVVSTYITTTPADSAATTAVTNYISNFSRLTPTRIFKSKDGTKIAGIFAGIILDAVQVVGNPSFYGSSYTTDVIWTTDFVSFVNEKDKLPQRFDYTNGTLSGTFSFVDNYYAQTSFTPSAASNTSAATARSNTFSNSFFVPTFTNTTMGAMDSLYSFALVNFLDSSTFLDLVITYTVPPPGDSYTSTPVSVFPPNIYYWPPGYVSASIPSANVSMIFNKNVVTLAPDGQTLVITEGVKFTGSGPEFVGADQISISPFTFYKISDFKLKIS